MSSTRTARPPSDTTLRPATEAIEGRAGRPALGRSPTPPGAHPSNPVRIGCIGTDRIQVSIRPAFDDAELLALVDRLEQLVDAGYDTIDVVLEGLDPSVRPDGLPPADPPPTKGTPDDPPARGPHRCTGDDPAR